MAPFTCEHLWEEEIEDVSWDDMAGERTIEVQVEIVIQENGKFRGKAKLKGNEEEQEIVNICSKESGIGEWEKYFLVDKRVINFVTGKGKNNAPT